MSAPVSIVIPTRNEAINLGRCLQSVAWASEKFVVDSNSTDATGQIAENFGASVVQFDYQGGWPKKKNWALANLPFRNEWVLLLDADEVLCNGGSEEIDHVLRSDADIAGYWINRRFMFLGKWLKHAYYPNWNLRLFKHKLGRFERLIEGETNSGDVEIHEHLIVRGRTARLKTELEHYAYPSVESFIEKHNRYSNWESQLERELDKRTMGNPLQDRRVNFRRRLKRLSKKLPMRPLLRFWYVFFIQRGFLDGLEGYYFAQLHACYEWMSLIKTFERAQDEDRRLGD
jgi:glycosyltransferase involved in cell wall biosynthesis